MKYESHRRGFVSRPVDFPRGKIDVPLPALDAVTFDVAVQRGVAAQHEQELRTIAFRPLLALIKEDAEAQKAIAELGRLVAIRRDTVPKQHTMFGPSHPTHEFGPGLTFLFPPYDLERGGPTSGNGAGADANRVAGTCDASGHPGGQKTSIAASASIGVALFPSQDGILSVRPLVRYASKYREDGWLSFNAHTDGTVWVTALSEQNDVLEHVDQQIWSDTSETHSDGEDSGYVLWIDELRFPVKAGTLYKVFVGVTVSLNQTGDHAPPFGSSEADADLNIQIPWIVVEL